MKIKIIKCSNSILWYNSRIGEEFNVIWEETNAYWTREGGTYNATNWVYKQDCEVVTD